MYFFTATINSWKSLLTEEEFKSIISDSFKWFHENKRAAINGFVIMPNHIHVLWQPLSTESAQLLTIEELHIIESKNERDFLSFTGHQFKKKLKESNIELLEEYCSTQHNKEYHFWERRSRTIAVESREIAEQKLDYVHLNPCQPKWNLCAKPSDYKFSSARYYETNTDDFGWLTHYYEFS